MGRCGCGAGPTCGRHTDEGDSFWETTEDELCLDAEHLTAETAEGAVATRVRAATETVVRAVHFDDQTDGRREEVGDGVAEDDLAAEGDA